MPGGVTGTAREGLPISINARRQRAERNRTKNIEQPETSNEANVADRPNDVARLRCTPSLDQDARIVCVTTKGLRLLHRRTDGPTSMARWPKPTRCRDTPHRPRLFGT